MNLDDFPSAEEHFDEVELDTEPDYNFSAYRNDYSSSYGTGGMIGEHFPDTEMDYQDAYGNSFSSVGV